MDRSPLVATAFLAAGHVASARCSRSDRNPGGWSRFSESRQYRRGCIIFRVEIFPVSFWRNHHSVGNACVFVNDSAIDYAVAADARWELSPNRDRYRVRKISAHHHAITNGRAALNNAAHPDNACARCGPSDMMHPSEMMAWRRVAPLILLPGRTGMTVNRRVGFEKTVSRN